MDPVNPAPAGNPQLTTHLLVSHKKNKNFHPCKVKLIKTASKLISFPISSDDSIEPLINRNFKIHINKMRRTNYHSNSEDFTVTCGSDIFGVTEHIRHFGWHVYLKLARNSQDELKQTGTVIDA